MSVTGYERDFHRNVERLAASAERIAAALEALAHFAEVALGTDDGGRDEAQR